MAFPPRKMEHILPPNATEYERTLASEVERILEIDADQIRYLWNPWKCKEELLPFLAWSLSVDVWFDEWPIAKKRRVVAEAIKHHQIKGTLAGTEAYLDLVDASLIDSVLPPQQVVARPYDKERLERFKAQFAELRITPYSVRDRRPGIVAKSGSGAHTAIVGNHATRPDLGLHYGRRATVVDDGEELVIRSQDQVKVSPRSISAPVTVLAIPGKARAGESLIGHRGVGHAVAHRRSQGRLLTIGTQGVFTGIIPDADSGLSVLDSNPEKVYERHDGKGREIVAKNNDGRSVVGKSVARISRASRFIYDRWYLFDKERAGVVADRAIGPVVGRMMAKLTPFTGMLRVKALFEQHGHPATSRRSPVGRTIARGHSNRVDDVGFAINRSKAFRDHVRYTTKSHRPVAIQDLSFDHPVAWAGMVPVTKRTS